uniref:Histone chaperone domain-containing protein n=1 Tax=Tetraselmis sp. GSL018 TaxID=582737 RepID=A0A061R8X5_9CHLO|eukprot:CAMPEP_0177592750 /NCGR_PEP_ID=MMETSP0419_2-20121207/8732_1 /TAXON_ID=582737 /ORGANISM="Tetraselmis sp., Strain GSL018" /LENGTH=327 /DNA_ID=CAMNT_0019083649 /DNA_START=671 /DNA_END=1654 /DNA_ORIENTATION=+
MTGLSAEAVEKAFYEHEGYFKENSNSITKKGVRRYLEERLRLDKGSLDEHKELLSELCTKLVESLPAADEEEHAEPHGSKVKKRKAKPSGELEAGGGSKQQRRSAAEPASKGGGGRPPPSARVSQLKEICKLATITIPPNTYRGKDDNEVCDRFVALLERHGLSPSSTPSDIRSVKQKLQKERELDGIDTSNIIEGRPRRGATATATARTRYTAAAQDSDESSDGGSDRDDAAGGGSGKAEGRSGGRTGEEYAAPKTKVARATVLASDDEEDGGGGPADEGGEREDREEVSGGDSDEPSEEEEEDDDGDDDDDEEEEYDEDEDDDAE